MPGPQIILEATGFDKVYRRLDRYAVRPMENAWARASMAGARIAARAIRAAAPVGLTRKLQRSVRARRTRARGLGAVLTGQGLGVAIAGPNARHRHLVIRGHRIVTVRGQDTGRRSRSNPFVDRAVAATRPAWEAAIRRELRR